MKKIALLFVFATSCNSCLTNNAANFARLVDARAVCTPLVTSQGCGNSSRYDTAVCNVGNEVWDCVADIEGRERPNCIKIREKTPEKP